MQSENAIVDPDNLLIELSHVRAAAAEMPLTMDDIGLFPDLGEIILVLLKAEEVKGLSGRFAWAGPAFPAIYRRMETFKSVPDGGSAGRVSGLCCECQCRQRALIRKIHMDCPLCDKVHEIEERKRITTTLIKGEETAYEERFYFCANSDEDENEFETGSMTNENLMAARNPVLRTGIQYN